MEYIGGGTLMNQIVDKKGLNEHDALLVTRQMLSALAYCAERGILHRDLKPENILMTDDQPPIIKITDFGLARFLDADTPAASMTFCGTPDYLAPELIAGMLGQNSNRIVQYDDKVDMWGIGIIVFSM